MNYASNTYSPAKFAEATDPNAYADDSYAAGGDEESYEASTDQGDYGSSAFNEGYASEAGGDGHATDEASYNEETDQFEPQAGELSAWEQKEKETWASLEQELSGLDPASTPAIYDFLQREIAQRKSSAANPEFMRCDAEKVTLRQKIFCDVDGAPDTNFVGQILGPGGHIAKRIALEANVKIAVQGRGSMKDKEKEQELLNGGSAEHEHLRHPLHVSVETKAPPARAWANMQRALNQLMPLASADGATMPAAPPVVPMRGRLYRPGAPYYLPLARYPPTAYAHPYAMRASSFGKMRGRGRGRAGHPF